MSPSTALYIDAPHHQKHSGKMRVIDVIAVISLTVATAATLPETQGVHLPTPTRELEWKEVNFLSISDTHGELPRLDRGSKLIPQAGYWDINM